MSTTIHRSPIHRSSILALALALATVALAACGSDSDDSSAAASGDGDTSSAAASSNGTYDIASVASCLSDAGFEVTREADQDDAFRLPEEYKESIGLTENIQLGGIGDARGIGAVAFFENVSSALDEFDAASAFRAEEVSAGTVGTANWDYLVTAGDDPGAAAAIQGCLG